MYAGLNGFKGRCGKKMGVFVGGGGGGGLDLDLFQLRPFQPMQFRTIVLVTVCTLLFI